MNILIVGQGGREHAMAWKLSLSNKVDTVYVAPGNGGTANENKCINIDIAVNDFLALEKLVIEKEINLIVIGPEDPLVNGIKDHFQNKNFLILL